MAHTATSIRYMDRDLEQCRALLGRRLADRFEVCSVIGYGGSSIIFEGWHLVLRHPVAVKVLRASYATDSHLVEHFAQEAMVTAQMRSPNVVRVFDTGLLDEGVPYTVLELLKGQTLREHRNSGGSFGALEAVDLVLQACRALDESHRHGIVHRDIKPDNLFLAELPDGAYVLKVIDFGVAKHSSTDDALSNAWVGTPGYMAPEQIKTPGEVDERADVWALGVVLFELLTGRSPFRGATTEDLLTSTLTDDPLPLEVIERGLPPELYATVRSCLSKDPRARCPSVQVLANELRRSYATLTQVTTQPSSNLRAADTWDLRMTPPHGWELPQPARKGRRPVRSAVRQFAVGAALVASAAVGVVIANHPLDPSAVNTAARTFDSEQGPRVEVSANFEPRNVWPTFDDARAERELQRAEALDLEAEVELNLPTPIPSASIVAAVNPAPEQRPEMELGELLKPWTASAR